MSPRTQTPRDLRRLYAGLAMMGDVANWSRLMSAGMGPEDVRLVARFYWRMADAMLATEEERT